MKHAPTVSITPLRLVVCGLEEMGLDWEPILRACGIRPALLDDCEARVSEESFYRVFTAAEEITGDPCIGLHIGEHLRPRAVCVLSYLMLSSATVGEGLERVGRFQRIVSREPWLVLERCGPVVHVRAGMQHMDDDVRAIHAEYVAVLLLRFVRWVTEAELDAIEIDFQHAARSRPAEYERVLRSPVKFESGESSLLLSAPTLERRSVHANREIARVHEELARCYLERLDDTSTVAHVKRALAPVLESGAPDLRAVSRALHVSSRTLQRRLAEEGTSFSKVLDALRRDLALDHLRDRDTPLAEIAYLTGFSEASAFTRAVRRWVGQTPLEHRRAARRRK